MHYDFQTLIDRDDIGNMKSALGKDIAGASPLVLAGAEMDYATAPVIRDALADFARRGLYGFTLPDDAYWDAIRGWMKAVRNLEVSREEIVPTHGTIFGICTAIRAFTGPGDGVIVQHPAYYRYDAAIQNIRRNVVSNPLLETDGVYQLDFEDLSAKMSNPQNKLMILCNPHNPTGRVFDRADLETIADLAKKHGVIVVSDEIFAEVTFDGHTATPYCQISPENSIVLTSLGKTFNFTGVNHANAIIREPVLRERYLAQRRADHFGSIDPFFYTAIRAAYSEAGLAWVREMREHTWQNYLVMKGCFADRLPDFRLSPLEGTYVAWIDCRGLGLNDQELAAFFRECANVIVDPGTDYGPGGSGFVRISIATPRSQIQRFLDLLTQGCNTIRKRRSAS